MIKLRGLLAGAALFAGLATQAHAIPMQESYLGAEKDSTNWILQKNYTAQFNFDLTKTGGEATLKNGDGALVAPVAMPTLDETRYNPDTMKISYGKVTFNFSDHDQRADKVNLLAKLSIGDLLLGKQEFTLGGINQSTYATTIFEFTDANLLKAIQGGTLLTLAVTTNDNHNDITLDKVTYDVTTVPEPGTMMLLGAGFLGLAVYGKRRKNA
jgi:hypothetical protein